MTTIPLTINMLIVSCTMWLQEPFAHINSLEWLGGCWEGSFANGRTVSEQWIKPSGGMMLGTSRTVRNGKSVAFEFIRIEQSDDGSIRYIAHPSGQSETVFLLVKTERRQVIFENPTHDFPQRIFYTLITPDSLIARIEGTVNGKVRSSDFPYRRVHCE